LLDIWNDELGHILLIRKHLLEFLDSVEAFSLIKEIS
jgi:hypothetical protein